MESSTERKLIGTEGQEMLLFYSGYSPFSNFNCARFRIAGICYRSVEQFIDAEKARRLGRSDLYQRVMSTVSPRVCFDVMQTEVTEQELAQVGWYNVILSVLETGLRAKFSQSAHHKQQLLATGSSRLVFTTPFDCVLGNGLMINDPDCGAPHRWQGDNQLGRILEKLRDELSQGTSHDANPALGRKRSYNDSS